jgi:hypothetical protein
MRAKPSRKTKSKGNHLKNLQNRIEIKNEYEQVHVSMPESAPTPGNVNSQQQSMLVNELANHRKFEKSTVS